jgi:Amidohydrolase
MTGNPDTSLTIDTHHHILPDFFWRETNDSHAPVGGLAPLQWSKEAMISFMDDAGIDVAVMSVSTPGVHLGDSEKARSLARRCNEFAAELVHTRPDRFASFACIPLPDIDASLEELSYAVDVLRLDGLVLFTNSNGVYLGDATLEPVFEELAPLCKARRRGRGRRQVGRMDGNAARVRQRCRQIQRRYTGTQRNRSISNRAAEGGRLTGQIAPSLNRGTRCSAKLIEFLLRMALSSCA